MILKNSNRWKVRSRSLHYRLTITILLVTLFTLISSAVVSYIALVSMEKNKTESAMIASLEQMTNHMDQAYLSMLQISLQMLPQGTTGQLFEEYIRMDSPYEVYRLRRLVGEELVTLGFPNSELCMMAYYNQNDKEAWFSSFALEDEFDPDKINTLVQVGNTQYHTCHVAKRKYQKGTVVSLVREVNFLGAPGTQIYIESLVDLAAYVENDTNSAIAENLPCILLQADENGVIQYSSNERELNPVDGWKVSDFLEEGATQGKTKEYFVVAKSSRIGYTNLMLIHLQDYQRELHNWLRQFFLVALISLILFYGATTVIQRLIYHPIKELEAEFGRFGEGSFEKLEYNSGIMEFDKLVDQFNQTKQQVQTLLEDVSVKEQEKHQLETEKLMYQINPHFLMNTLNSVNWLAKMHGQKEISQFVTELNSMLAYNLGKTHTATTFRSEVEMLRNYINLQKMRYDFEAILEIEEGDYLDQPTVRMLLQPLVENAIRYGIGEQGIIMVKMFHDPRWNFVGITIEDRGKGLNKEELRKLSQPFRYQGDGRTENDGIGLRYVKSMLDSYYKEKAFLSINSELGKGTKITLLLPLEEKENEE